MSSHPEPRRGASVVEADPFRLGWRYVRKEGPDGEVDFEQVPLTPEDVLHPQEEDFIVQGERHVQDCLYIYSVLRRLVRGRPGVRVFHDHRMDWGVEGVRPHGPDFTVLEGVPEDRDTLEGTVYVGAIGARVLLVIEVTSPTTRENDLVKKVAQYDQAGIPWYFIVDQLSAGPDPLYLLGYRATAEGFTRLRPDERGRLWVEPLCFWLAFEDGRAVCYDEQGHRVPDNVELAEVVEQTAARMEEAEADLHEADARAQAEARARQEAEARARQEMQLRQQKEQEIAAMLDRLQAQEEELRRLRGQP